MKSRRHWSEAQIFTRPFSDKPDQFAFVCICLPARVKPRFMCFEGIYTCLPIDLGGLKRGACLLQAEIEPEELECDDLATGLKVKDKATFYVEDTTINVPRASFCMATWRPRSWS